jgi:hypothetical protein
MAVRRVVVCLVALIVSFGIAGPVSAANGESGSGPLTSQPVWATFQGSRIDLADGWGGAKACLVWRSQGLVECFATVAELKATEAQLRPATLPDQQAAKPATECSSSLDLYSGSNFAGRELSLWDEGYWQELSEYGLPTRLGPSSGVHAGFTWPTGPGARATGIPGTPDRGPRQRTWVAGTTRCCRPTLSDLNFRPRGPRMVVTVGSCGVGGGRMLSSGIASSTSVTGIGLPPTASGGVLRGRTPRRWWPKPS